VLFTGEDRGPDARIHTPQCPYGEADLLLGFDAVETLRALGPDPYLRVAAPDKTFVVANLGGFEDQVQVELAAAIDTLPRALPLATRQDGAMLADISGTARREFLTDRVADLIALGAAFQRGFIPVSVEAMESAMRRLEARGYGRSLEAFDFGRRLAEGLETAEGDGRKGESLGRLVRRTALELEASRHGGRRRARQFREIVRGALDAMPALYATNDGRQALRDFVNACARCVAWGGVRHLRWYAGLVRDMYDADADRSLCTFGILPLAEAVLIRDALYVASVQAGVGQARRIRERLGLTSARATGRRSLRSSSGAWCPTNCAASPRSGGRGRRCSTWWTGPSTTPASGMRGSLPSASCTNWRPRTACTRCPRRTWSGSHRGGSGAGLSACAGAIPCPAGTPCGFRLKSRGGGVG
jgi:Pyruvate/2-oxoacid:ferredoxin oxidoreductase gamma subunit